MEIQNMVKEGLWGRETILGDVLNREQLKEVGALQNKLEQGIFDDSPENAKTEYIKVAQAYPDEAVNEMVSRLNRMFRMRPKIKKFLFDFLLTAEEKNYAEQELKKLQGLPTDQQIQFIDEAYKANKYDYIVYDYMKRKAYGAI